MGRRLSIGIILCFEAGGPGRVLYRVLLEVYDIDVKIKALTETMRMRNNE